MTANVAIDGYSLPTGQDAPGWPEFVEITALHSLIDFHTLELDIYDQDPVELLSYLSSPYQHHSYLVARVNGQIVGVARNSWAPGEDANVTWIEGGVHPEFRNQGIGESLLTGAVAAARESGRAVIQTGAVHVPGDGESIPAATGYGAVALSDPGVRFLRNRGYTLEQVERLSVLHLPIYQHRFATMRAEAEAKAGTDYRLQIWHGPAPDAWVDDVARIRDRLHTDAPSGDLDVDAEPWDAARVRDAEVQDEQSGRIRLAAAVEHVPSGRLVALTNLLWMTDPTKPVRQGMTLVLKEHRGHRLGMLVKIANLEALAGYRPDATIVITDNAEENRPMLDVNDAVGFVPVGYVGLWKRVG